jgi:hypothetical protein
MSRVKGIARAAKKRRREEAEERNVVTPPEKRRQYWREKGFTRESESTERRTS